MGQRRPHLESRSSKSRVSGFSPREYVYSRTESVSLSDKYNTEKQRAESGSLSERYGPRRQPSFARSSKSAPIVVEQGNNKRNNNNFHTSNLEIEIDPREHKKEDDSEPSTPKTFNHEALV